MKKRKDSFWGLHLDFHAKPTDGIQGLTLEEENIREICRLLKPDFIQIDCKGHSGWTSYPSKLGNAMPEFAKDTLELWRRVTREENVALYMHYSGVFDRKYCVENPNEAVLSYDGTRSKEATRPNGAYVDDLLIPQFMELAGDYQVNGVWVDGECWMSCSDFSKETVAAFENETGITLNGNLPTSCDKPYYYEYRDYNRELFRRYLRHYVDAVHEKYPDFEICSNWAFSDHMPEEVSVNVDFLSGDLNPLNSFNSARYAARALAQQEGYVWDLMSWNFRSVVGGRAAYTTKHVNQMKQEAAAVIALGGAYQNYVPQNRDGSPKMWELRNLKELSSFVLERKDFCHRGTPVHQAALLLSTFDRNRESQHLYTRSGYERVMGLSSLLCDIGQSLEIVCEHTLKKNISEYKMIVVPETFYGLKEETVRSLLEYARRGGKLVLVGKKTCSIFADAGAPFTCNDYVENTTVSSAVQNDGHNNKSSDAYKPYSFTIDKSCFGSLFSPCEITAESSQYNAFFAEKPIDTPIPLSATMPYGDGQIAAIGFDIGIQYHTGTQYLHRELMKRIADSLYTPIAHVDAALGRLEIVVLNKDNKLMLQLVNGGGSHADSSSATDDYIPPVLDIKLTLDLPNTPKKLILQPENKELPFTVAEDGTVNVYIDRVDIHNIIEVR